MKRLLMAGAMSLGLLTGGAALAGDALPADADPRLATNPALAEIYGRDADAAAEILGGLDAIGAAPMGETLPKSDTRALADEDPLLVNNPALQEAYRRDPRATAKLIDIIRPNAN